MDTEKGEEGVSQNGTEIPERCPNCKIILGDVVLEGDGPERLVCQNCDGRIADIELPVIIPTDREVSIKGRECIQRDGAIDWDESLEEALEEADVSAEEIIEELNDDFD